MRNKDWDSRERVEVHHLGMDRLERLITPTELAEYLGVPIATLYVWRHRRLGPPSFKAGRHLRYRRRDVEQWIDNRVEKVYDSTMARGK